MVETSLVVHGSSKGGTESPGPRPIMPKAEWSLRRWCAAAVVNAGNMKTGNSLPGKLKGGNLVLKPSK